MHTFLQAGASFPKGVMTLVALVASGIIFYVVWLNRKARERQTPAMKRQVGRVALAAFVVQAALAFLCIGILCLGRLYSGRIYAADGQAVACFTAAGSFEPGQLRLMLAAVAGYAVAAALGVVGAVYRRKVGAAVACAMAALVVMFVFALLLRVGASDMMLHEVALLVLLVATVLATLADTVAIVTVRAAGEIGRSERRRQPPGMI